jgi:hypothetical protein
VSERAGGEFDERRLQARVSRQTGSDPAEGGELSRFDLAELGQAGVEGVRGLAE